MAYFLKLRVGRDRGKHFELGVLYYLPLLMYFKGTKFFEGNISFIKIYGSYGINFGRFLKTLSFSR